MGDKISVVVMAKNDDYGGHLIHRAKHVLTNLINEFDEVIYVDWKSEGKPLHEEFINELESTGKLICYTVTQKDIDEVMPQYSNYSIVDVVGRNIGIRRAKNDWVLVTNIDIILKNFDTSEFKDNVLYTAARREVSIDEHIQFTDTKELVSHLESKRDSYRLQQDTVINGKAVWDEGDVWSLVVACGDFQFAHKNVWNGIRGFEESLGGRGYADSNLMKKGAIYFNIEKCFTPLYHLNHTSSKNGKEGEILPGNNRLSSVNDFTETTNSENWGWNNYELKKIVK
jgi:hypothetical protein